MHLTVKPDTKGHIKCSMHGKYPEKANIQKHQITDHLGLRVVMKVNWKWTQWKFVAWQNIQKLDFSDCFTIYKLSRNRWIIHLQWVNVMVCKLNPARTAKNSSFNGGMSKKHRHQLEGSFLWPNLEPFEHKNEKRHEKMFLVLLAQLL